MMVHGTSLHNRSLGDAIKKRSPFPEPDPGLVGDLVNGVGDIAGDAVGGVVGLVTTALSDVNDLIAPQRAAPTSQSTTKATSSPNAPATTTAAPAVTTPASGGSSSGVPSGGSSGNNGGSGGSDSGSSNGNGSTGGPTNNGGGSGTPSDGTPGSGSSGNESGISGGSSVSGNGGENIPGSQTGSSGLSPSGVLNVEPGRTDASGHPVTASPVINAVGSADSDDSDSLSPNSLSSGVQGTTTVRSTGRSGPTGTSGSGPGGNGGANDNGASSANSSRGLSPGVIAAVVVICSLALLVFIVFIMRKWYRRRRARRFETWVSRPGAFTFFGGASVSVNKESDEKSAGEMRSGSGTRSARSSFGTTYDLGHSPDPFSHPSATNFSDFFTASNASPIAVTPRPGTATPIVQRPENVVDRQSLISIGSSSSSSYGSGSGSGHSGSGTANGNTSTGAVEEARGASDDLHAQYLIVPESHTQQDSANRPQLSPISVRPWSPSERWAFPKPPVNTAASAEKTIFYEPPVSPVKSQSAHVEHVPATNLPPLSPLAPPAQHDPFADPSQVESEARGSSAASARTKGAITAQTSASHADGIVGAVEYIRRPFVPTLADELNVRRGDTVRVLQAFDDGWVQVEKLSSATDSNVASTSKTSPVPERGLIPVDCLREAGEPLPSFLASRRVSSYYGSGSGVAL